MYKAVIAFLLVVSLTACGSVNPTVEPAPQTTSDVADRFPVPGGVPVGEDGAYEANWTVNQGLHIYDLTGIVQAAPGSNSTYSAQGGYSGYGNGYASGWMSAGTDGKGIIKLLIQRITFVNPYEAHGYPDSAYEPLAAVGDVRIIKVVDAAASVLAAGEEVTFRCRIDRDFMQAAAANERPTTDGITSEFDFCRLISDVRGGNVITGTVPLSSTLGR